MFYLRMWSCNNPTRNESIIYSQNRSINIIFINSIYNFETRIVKSELEKERMSNYKIRIVNKKRVL